MRVAPLRSLLCLLVPAALLFAPAGAATPHSAAPVADRTSAMVRADALPTVQIDGVAWAQAVVGNVVFVGGSFSTARPAGAAPGTSTRPRWNLLAYDLRTGVLITGFAPNVNAPVRALAASPDGKRLYVGGEFTTVDGRPHYRLAAVDIRTRKVITGFTAGTDSTVNALAATNTTVYAGGAFSHAGTAARSKLAAFSAAGRLTAWNPGANASVLTMTTTPAHTRIIAGGAFTQLAGVSAPGSGSVDAKTGAARPWALNQVVRNNMAGDTQAAIYSLTHDGSLIYGTGYKYHGVQQPGMLEGSFAADPSTGKVVWIQACHGDTYSAYSTGLALYTVGHAHDCTWINAFGGSTGIHYALALSLDATGTDRHDTSNPASYSDFGGQPAPSLITWFPDFVIGTYTGLHQAGWSVTGNGSYVVIGGEFTKVNNVAQQGLVRFVNRPGKQGPRLGGVAFHPSVAAVTATRVTLTVAANYDRDDRVLTYALLRDGRTVATTRAAGTFWLRPTVTLTDPAALPGSTHGYRIKATDSDGNSAVSDTVRVTTPQ